MTTRRPALRLLAFVAAVLGVLGLSALMRLIPVISATAAAPVLLLQVLFIARAWGTGPALAGALSAGLAFSYFFLPLTGHFIEDLSDWAAFITFTLAALLVGELSARAERRQLEAEEGRREIEQLYQQLGAAFERASDAEAARRNEQLKAALLDALTHNLRTPLTAIKASVTALLGGGRPNSSPLTREGRSELLQVIDEESDRLNRFIEGLSTADTSDASHAPSLRVMPLDELVEDAIRRASTVVRDHRVQRSLDPSLPGLAVDPGAVVEVLYMLLDNASKYSPPGTTIRIETARAAPHHARITVSDEGPGIPASYREQVFDKFFRIPGREPGDPRRGGIGLGLPIARRLVESQAGTIRIETPPNGVGTSMVLTLPLGSRTSAPAPEPAAASA